MQADVRQPIFDARFWCASCTHPLLGSGDGRSIQYYRRGRAQAWAGLRIFCALRVVDLTPEASGSLWFVFTYILFFLRFHFLSLGVGCFFLLLMLHLSCSLYFIS